jgi:hypothetical protein
MMVDLGELCRQHTGMFVGVVVDIAHNKSAHRSVRMRAVELLARYGLVDLLDPQKLGGFVRDYYVYSIHDDDGRLIYIGKGKRFRHLASAKRCSGVSRIRAEFYSEAEALRFELRLIKRFRPRLNILGV